MRLQSVLWILMSLALGLSARRALAGTEPYEGIAKRNMFGLREGTPAPVPTVSSPPRITLTGITTILGDRRALMNVLFPARPGHPAKRESYMLAEHERQGTLEVLAIDERAGKVKLNEAGSIVTVSFEQNGLKATSLLPNATTRGFAGRSAGPPSPTGTLGRRYATPGLVSFGARPRQGQTGRMLARTTASTASGNWGSPGASSAATNSAPVAEPVNSTAGTTSALASEEPAQDLLSPEEQRPLMEQYSFWPPAPAAAGPGVPPAPFYPPQWHRPTGRFPMLFPQ